MRTLSRLYDRLEDAEGAVRELLDAGFDTASISLISPRSSKSLGLDAMDEMAEPDDPDAIAVGAAIGATLGAAVGGTTGLLMGLGLLIIPGVGPALAIGPLASAIAGLSMGGATGGVAGALARTGVPPLESNEYSLALRRGDTLLLMQVPVARMMEAGAILDRHNPIPMATSRAELMEGGHERRMFDAGPAYRKRRRGERHIRRRRNDPPPDLLDDA